MLFFSNTLKVLEFRFSCYNTFMSDSTFVLIDAHANIYRAFYAFPPLTTKQGVLVNAVFGFTKLLLNTIRDLKPKYIAIAFDLPKPTFRHTQFAGYKAQRKEMPSELQSQIQLVKQVVTALNIPQLSVEGYEADDVIGTLSRQYAQDCPPDRQIDKIMIVTGDRDAFQLVTDCVHVLLPPNGKKGEQEFGPAEVEAKMGVRPDQIVDYKAIAGDASDNIPGVKGVGDKTAVRLLQEFGTIEELYRVLTEDVARVKASSVLKPAMIQKLLDGYEMLKMSKELATIDRHVPLSVELDDCRLNGYDRQAACAVFEEFEFKSLKELLPPDEFELGIQEALFL